MGNLKNFIKSCLGSVIYGNGEMDGEFLKDEVDKDGGGLNPTNHPKVRQTPEPTLQSTLCHMVHPPAKRDGPQEHERLETISKAQPCKLHH